MNSEGIFLRYGELLKNPYRLLEAMVVCFEVVNKHKSSKNVYYTRQDDEKYVLTRFLLFSPTYTEN